MAPSIGWKNDQRFALAVREYLEYGKYPTDLQARRVVNWLDKQFPESQGYTRTWQFGRISITRGGDSTEIPVFIQGANSSKPIGAWSSYGVSWDLAAGSFTTGAEGYRWSRKLGKPVSLNPKQPPSTPKQAPMPAVDPLPTSLPNTNGFFPAAPNGFNRDDYINVFTTVDTETGPGDKLVSLAAITLGQHRDTGAWHRLDEMQRYYLPDYRLGHGLAQQSVTGYTEDVARAYRELQSKQGLVYSKYYNNVQAQQFYSYLKRQGGVLVGQNIVGFDMDRLFPGNANWYLKQNVFDTITVMDTFDIAKAFRPNQAGFNRNQDLFKIVYGQTMERAGLTMHGAHPDAVATGVVYTHMMQDPAMSRLITALREGSITYATVPKWSTPYLPKVDDPVFKHYLTREAHALALNQQGQGGKMDPTFIDSINNFADAVLTISEEFGSHTAQMTEGIADLSSIMRLNQVASRIRIVTEAAQIPELSDRQALYQHLGLDSSTWNNIETLVADKQKRAERVTDLQRLKLIDKYESNPFYRAFYYPGTPGTDAYGNFVGPQNTEEMIDQINSKSIEERAEAYYKLDQAIAKTTEKFNTFSDVFSAIGEAYNFQSWSSTASGELSGINKAAKSLVPSSLSGFYSPIERLVKAGQNQLAMWGNKASFGNSMWSTISGVAGAINPIAGGITQGIGALTQIPGQLGQYQIAQTGEEIQRRLWLLSSTMSLVTAPLTLLGSAAKIAVGGLRSLTNFIKSSMGTILQYGTPWTPLTGVGASGYAASRYADYAYGLQVGTTNNTLNNWSMSQMGLYTMGEMDTSRLISSAMLGQFTNVYANGGDAQSQYSSFMDDVYRQLQGASGTDRQRLMWLASQVDSNAPQILSRMEAVNKELIARNKTPLTYTQMSSPSTWGVYSNPLTKSELATNYVVGFQYQAQKEQWNNSKMRLGAALWTAAGNPAMNIVNQLMDSLVQAVSNGDWRSAFKQVGDVLGDAFKKIKDAIDGFKDSSTFAQLRDGIVGMWESMKPKILNVVGEIGNAIINAFWVIVGKIADNVGVLWERLGMIDFDYKVGKGLVVTDKAQELLSADALSRSSPINQTSATGGRYTGSTDVLNNLREGKFGGEGLEFGYMETYREASGKTTKEYKAYEGRAGYQAMLTNDQSIIKWNGRQAVASSSATQRIMEMQNQAYIDPKITQEQLFTAIISAYPEIAEALGLREYVNEHSPLRTFMHEFQEKAQVAQADIAREAFITTSSVADSITDGTLSRIATDTMARVEITLRDGNGQLLTSLTLDENNKIIRQNIISTHVASLVVQDGGTTK